MVKGRKTKPRTGTWFSIPLSDDEFAIGLISRTGSKFLCLGYFFPHVGESEPPEQDLETFVPGSEVLIGQFGSSRIVDGAWPVIKIENAFEHGQWPIPSFGRVDEVAGRAWISTYDDNLAFVSEEDCEIEVARELPYDRVMGPGALVTRLCKLLGIDRT